MTESLRDTRASQIAKYLMDIKIPQTEQQITLHFKWGHSGTNRSLPIVKAWGILIEDRTRTPYTYQYKPGSQINFFPPFKFIDEPEEEMEIREMCQEFIEHTTRDWHTPPINSYQEAIIYAAIYGMGFEEMEHRQQYEEWLSAIAPKLRQYYLAYRIVKSIKAMPAKDRNLKKYGIDNRLKGQDKDDTMSMSWNFLATLKATLDGIQ